MQRPEDVAAMLRLKACGRGTQRIADELGVGRNTVKPYLRQGGWAPYASPQRTKSLDGLEDWLQARFLPHAGNAAVILQDLQLEHGLTVSLRTAECACVPFRQALAAEAKATVRFKTPPGKQRKIDFGSRQITIGDEAIKVCLFVATLGYSRRHYVRAFRHERQSAWFAGLEVAFRHFGAGCRSRCCWITPGPWWTTTTRRPAKWGTVAPSEMAATLPSSAIPPAALRRDLTEYEAVVGGGW